MILEATKMQYNVLVSCHDKVIPRKFFNYPHKPP